MGDFFFYFSLNLLQMKVRYWLCIISFNNFLFSLLKNVYKLKSWIYVKKIHLIFLSTMNKLNYLKYPKNISTSIQKYNHNPRDEK